MKLALILLLLAQAVNPHPPAQNAKQWTIEGDITTGAGPAPGARVRASGPEWLRDAVADGKGHYVLKGAVSGTFILSASKDGSAPSEPKAIRVLAGALPDSVDFHLGKMAVISGRVLDSHRRPVQGATVSACVKLHHNGRMGLGLEAYGVTDDLGQYRIAGLGRGSYVVMISLPKLKARKYFPPVRRANTLTKRPAITRISFYPGVESLDAATPIVLSEGMERPGTDIVLPQADSFCIRTKIVPYSRELPASLWLDQAIGDAFPTIAADKVTPDEEWEICGITPGQYWLHATTWDPKTFKTRAFARTLIAVTDRDINAGTLYAMPGTDVTGKVSIEDTTGESDQDSLPPNLSVQLKRRGRPILYGEDLIASVAPDGSFTIRNVFPDEYGLSVSGLPDGYYVAEAKQQGIDVTHGPVLPGHGDLLISLASGAAVISGTAVDADNHPVPDAAIILIPEKASDKDFIVAQQSDQQGAFKFGGVVPGKYQLLALTGLFEGEDEDPDFLAGQMTAAVEVSVERQSSSTATLKVRSGH